MKTATALRQLLRHSGIIVAPGAYDCLTAKLIEREGRSIYTYCLSSFDLCCMT